MTSAAVPPERDRAEQHLRPAEDGIRLANKPVHLHSIRPQRLLVNVQLEVDAETELREDGDEENIGKFAVRAGEKSAPLVCVTKDIAAEGERDASSL